MFKKFNLFLIFPLLFLMACSFGNEVIQPQEESNLAFHSWSRTVTDHNELLGNTANVKFNETVTEEIRTHENFIGFAELTSMFVPYTLSDGMDISFIRVVRDDSMNFIHHDAAGRRILLVWRRDPRSPENATGVMFNRGAVRETIEEHNGIAYGISEWDCDYTPYRVSWWQHGYTFSLDFSVGFTRDEILAYAYVIPVESWQLDGDAVSVSVQAMADVTIRILSNDPMTRSDIRQELIISDDNLYIPSLSRDGSLELIGYRWLIDPATNRYQYVLAPGTYEFRASGLTANSELLVRHFESGEIVTVTDFTAEVSASGVTQFALIVTTDEVYDFTTEPGEPPELLAFSVTPDDFISIFETDRNTREWQVTFWVTETFGDGSQNRFTTDFIIPGPNANLRGSYAFADDHILAGHTIVFDIRNNGSNIVTFTLFNNNDPAGAELRAAYLTIESTDYLGYDVD